MIMRILLLPPYFFPEQMASTHLDNDRFTKYSKHDVDAEVIVPTPTRGISEEIREKYKNIKTEEMFNGHVHVHRFAMFAEGRNPVLRALRYALTNIVQYQRGKRCKGIDVVYSGSTPPTQGLLCGQVKKRLIRKYKRYVPYVYCLQDIFPDSLVNAKMTHEGSLIWRIGRRIENYTYRQADRIIVISEGFKRNIMAKNVPEEKIVVIPNWVDTSEIYPIERKDNDIFDKYSLDRGKFYICYSGNIGHSQNLDLLVEIAGEIERDMPDVCFVVVGEGVAKEDLRAMISQKGLSNFVLLPFQPYEDIAKVYNIGDVGLIISKPGIGGSSVPSKTWSIMAAGRPILASFDLDSDVADLITKLGCGSVARAGDKESMIKEIKRLYQADRSKIGSIGRNYVINELNSEKCTEMYLNVLKNVVANNGGACK